ncbi:MAG: hypothetical protein SOU02_05840 [Caecibacter massiliensis]|nr:hypothetical protein [Caecibacter massiliensis]
MAPLLFQAQHGEQRKTALTAIPQTYRAPILTLEMQLPGETANETLAVPQPAVPAPIDPAVQPNWPPNHKKGVQSATKPNCIRERKLSSNHSPLLKYDEYYVFILQQFMHIFNKLLIINVVNIKFKI